MVIQFLIFTACLFITYGVYLLMTRRSEAQRQEVQKRLEEVLLHSASSDDVDVLLARDELMSEIPWLNRALLHVRPATHLRKMIAQADLQMTVMRLLMFSALAGVLAFLAVSTLSSVLVLSLLAAVVAAVLPYIHVMTVRSKRLNKFLSLLPNALELMSRALAAGHAFQEALHMVATEMPEPVATEFRRTYEEQNLGLSLKLALENLAERIPLLDLRLCITAVLIQRETGGNLAEILTKVANTIRDRFRIFEDLKTLTTSSRMSAWILCGLPLFVGFIVTAMNPEHMSVLWHDPRGHKLIAIAVVMQITGMLMVRRILNIKV